MSWPRGRRKFYTEIGIGRVKCIRCGNPAEFQWQVCADRRYYRPLCKDCDIALNELVLTWAGDPDVQKKIQRYRKQHE